MRTVQTYTATIYVGTLEHGTTEPLPLELGKDWLHKYVNHNPLCVTFTPTEYIYTGRAVEGVDELTFAGEPGFVVGLINYPRFPVSPSTIREKALEIGEELRKLYKQFKVTVVFPDETVMLGN